MQGIYQERKPSIGTVVRPSVPTGQYWIDREFARLLRRGKAIHQRNPVLEANARAYFRSLTNWKADQQW